MLKKISLKIISVLAVFMLAIGMMGASNGHKKIIPENPILSSHDILEPEILYGENTDNDIEGDGETEIEEEDPEQEEPKEYERYQEKNKKNDETSGNENGNGNAGEKSSDGSDEIGIITDLTDKIVTTDELYNDEFSFIAYLNTDEEGYSLEVGYRAPRGRLETLRSDDNVYFKTLTLGNNTITLSLIHNGTVISSVDYNISYVAQKAGPGNETVGDSPPTIVTNLDGSSKTIENRNFTFHVTAKTGSGKIIYSDHIEVLMDGKKVPSPTGSTTFEYLIDFGESGSHILTVAAWDDEGNSAYKEYNVNYKKKADGENIGTATVTVDATTAGLGVVGSCCIDISQGETAAENVVRALDMMGMSALYNGTTKSGFYLKGVEIGPEVTSAVVPSELWNLIVKDDMPITGSPSGNSLCDYDFTAASGWMYSINGSLYPGKGLSEYSLNDGDVLILRFTLSYGKDISSSVSGYGSIGGYCSLWIDGGTVEIPENHRYFETAHVDPTDDEDGYVEFTCSKCGKSYTETLPATGTGEDEPGETHIHEYNEVDRLEPTETEDGWILYYCDGCGDIYYETIPAEGDE